MGECACGVCVLSVCLDACAGKIVRSSSQTRILRHWRRAASCEESEIDPLSEAKGMRGTVGWGPWGKCTDSLGNALTILQRMTSLLERAPTYWPWDAAMRYVPFSCIVPSM